MVLVVRISIISVQYQVMNAVSVTVIVIIYTFINYINNCNLHKWAYISEYRLKSSKVQKMLLTTV